MVTKLYGKINGNDVIFNRVSGNRWEAIIPADLDGIYVIDLYAEDEAGNMGHCAKALFTVDTNKLEIKIIFDEYEVRKIFDRYDVNITCKT